MLFTSWGRLASPARRSFRNDRVPPSTHLTLAEQAKILVAEAEENNLGVKVINERFNRWHACSLCEQQYHGIVACALGWACWKTYGAPEEAILAVQSNIADTYGKLGQFDRALRMRRIVYSGTLTLEGKESSNTLLEANNYASVLVSLERFEDAKSLLRKTMPVVRRVLGEGHRLTLKIRKNYARALYNDDAATLDDLREAATTLEDVAPNARRVFGGAHPLTAAIEDDLRAARAALRARETAPSGSA